MTTHLPRSYSGAAWASGPERLYSRLASELVGSVPVPLAGRHVLDLGAGTGAASRAAADAGARVTAADIELDMLRHDRASRPPCVAADAEGLPFGTDAFDACLLAFVISHVSDPRQMLGEVSRVVRPGGPVMASVFGPSSSHPAKDGIDRVAASFGYTPPAWYAEYQEATRLGAARMRASARAAGLSSVRVTSRRVRDVLTSPDELVSWRLGMAHLAPFVDTLGPSDRTALVKAALAAVGAAPAPYAPEVLILSSVVRA